LESHISVFGETFTFHQKRKMPLLKEVTTFRANPYGNGNPIGKRPISRNPSSNPVGKRPISKKPIVKVNEHELSNQDVTDIFNTWSTSYNEQNGITGTDAFLVAIGAAEEIPMKEDNIINTPSMEDSAPMEASQSSVIEPFEDFLIHENTWDIHGEATGVVEPHYVEPQLFSDFDSNFDGQVHAKPLGAIESVNSEPFCNSNFESQAWVPVSVVEGKKLLQTNGTEVLHTIDLSAIQMEPSPASTELSTHTPLLAMQPSADIAHDQETILPDPLDIPDSSWVPETFDQDMFMDDFCHAINSSDKKPDLLEYVLGEAGVSHLDSELNNPTPSYSVEILQGEHEKNSAVGKSDNIPLDEKPLKRGRKPSNEQKSLLKPRLSKVQKPKTEVRKKAGRPKVEEPIKITEVPKVGNDDISIDQLSSFKYRRMRDLNNVASRKCRVNRKMKMAEIEEELNAEQEKNVRLTSVYKQRLGQRDKLRTKLISMGLICPMGDV